MLDYIIVAISVFGIAWLLNKKYFNEKPLGARLAWLYTIIVFFIATMVMSALMMVRYENISNAVGVAVNPKMPIDFRGGVAMAFVFFTTIKRIKKIKYQVVTSGGNMVATFDSKEKAEEYLAKNENNGYELKEI